MQYINKFNKNSNNCNTKNKCNPVKSLYEVESFLNNLCNIKNSVNFIEQVKYIFKRKNF